MGWRIQEYRCAACESRFESLEDRDNTPESIDCAHCDGKAERIISAVRFGRRYGTAVTRGKQEAHPPHVLDTQGLGDGEDYGTWRDKLDKKQREERRKEVATWVTR